MSEPAIPLLTRKPSVQDWKRVTREVLGKFAVQYGQFMNHGGFRFIRIMTELDTRLDMPDSDGTSAFLVIENMLPHHYEWKILEEELPAACLFLKMVREEMKSQGFGIPANDQAAAFITMHSERAETVAVTNRRKAGGIQGGYIAKEADRIFSKILKPNNLKE